MKTSVALCTYNGEKYIAEQLDSILKQSIAVDEIIVCDDGSTDETMNILHKYHATFPNIFKIHQNKQTLKVIKNFEKAINLCTGDVIFLCDQDDVWYPHKVETVLNYFSENPEKEAVFHNLNLISGNHLGFTTLWESIYFYPNLFSDKKLFETLLILRNIVTGAAFAMKKQNSKFKFNLSNYHDYHLAIYFAKNNTLGILNTILGYYRIHSNQQVGTELKYEEYIERFCTIFDNHEPANFKLYILNNVLKGYNTDSKEISSLKNIIFKEKVITYRNEFLNSVNYIQRKILLVYWWLKNMHFVKYKDIFKDKFYL